MVYLWERVCVRRHGADRVEKNVTDHGVIR